MAEENRFEASFRPLTVSVAGAGLVALAMIDFAASGWSAFGPEARALTAAAARTAFMTFLVTAIALVAAYLARPRIGPIVGAVINSFGGAIFLAGTFVAGRLLGRAFDIEAPTSATPPADVAIFFAIAVLGLIGVTIVVLASLLRSVLAHRPTPSTPTEPEASE